MYPLVPQGISADLIATIEGFSRDDVDRFALASQQRAKAALEEGRFTKSVVPVRISTGTVALDHDEFPRPQTTLEALGNLEPSFVQLGSYVQKGDDLSFDDKARKVYPHVKRIDHVHTAGTRAASSTGPPPCSSLRRTTRNRAVSSRARACARSRLTAPSR